MVKIGVAVVDSDADGVSDGAGEPVVDNGIVVVGVGVSVSVGDGVPVVVVDVLSAGVEVVVMVSIQAMTPKVTYIFLLKISCGFHYASVNICSC